MYVSRPKGQSVEVSEERDAPRPQMPNVKHHETIGANGMEKIIIYKYKDFSHGKNY